MMTRRRQQWRLDSRARFAIKTSKFILLEHGLYFQYTIATYVLIRTSERDTVSSIGIVRGQHMLPGTIDGMTHVCYFRHALALDERRVKFLPEYSYGGSASPPKNNSEKSTSPISPAFHIHLLCFLIVIPLTIRLFLLYVAYTLVR